MVEAPQRRAPAKEAVFYLFRAVVHGPDIELSLAKARLGADGLISGRVAEWSNYEQALVNPPGFVREEDLAVFRLFRAASRASGHYGLCQIDA